MAADEWQIDPGTDYWVRVTGFPPRGPHLKAAKQRVERAGRHINEVIEFVRMFEEQNAQALHLIVDPTKSPDEGGTFAFDWSKGTPPPMSDIGIVVGEVIYNLRAALDYLVYALAWHDGGTPNEKSQFPIDAQPDDFWKNHRKKWLAGLSDLHVNEIAEYQPFKGCDWTATLNRLSNPDKHRNVTLVNPRWQARIRLSELDMHPVVEEPSKLHAILPDQKPHVVLEEDLPIVETLVYLTREVAAVLERFQAEFGESGTFTLVLNPGNPGS